MTTQDTTLPIVSLSCSSSNVTAAGNVTFTVNAADNAGIASVELRRNDVPIVPREITCEFDQAFKFEDNGIQSCVAVVTDSAGNVTTQTVPITVDIPSPIPFDAFAGLPLNQSLAGAAWDTAGRSWDAKTWMSGDGNGSAKIDLAQYGVFANYLSGAGDVGQAVLFKTTGARSASGNLLSISIDGAGSTTSSTVNNGVEALLNGGTTLYAKGDGKIEYASYAIDDGCEYWLEECKIDAKTYNIRLSKNESGKRGAVIASKQLVLTTARASTDRVVQLRTSTVNKDIIRILRVEALKVPFEIAGSGTSIGPGTGTTTAPPAPTAPTAAQYLYLENEASIAGPAGLTIKFGPQSAPIAVEYVEKLYSGKKVGFAGNTQSRWRCKPITVSNIQFIILVGLDSDGRIDVWVNAMFGTANEQTTINRERAAVSLQIARNGVALDLYGQGTKFDYIQPRATWIRYESKPLPMNMTHEFIADRIADRTFLPHDTRNIIASNEGAIDVDQKPAYIPFKKFSDTIASNGLPLYDIRYRIGTQYRGSSAGGERLDIGPVHEWYARLISEVGTNNNTAWLTDAKKESIRLLAETMAQYPQSSGMLDPSTGRLIDPSKDPFCCHRNAKAFGPCIGSPQAGMVGYNANNPEEMIYDWMYDTGHRANVGVSYHAHALSNDLWHLFETQASAIDCIAYGTGLGRGSDGKIARIVVEEERGFWWSFQAVLQAWRATPDGPIEKPFLPKSYFASVLDNTLQWIRDSLMAENAAYSSPAWQAAKFWRVLAPFTLPGYPKEIFASPFMDCYGNWVAGYMLYLGYSKGRDVAEWRFENVRLRAQAGGSWYAADKVLNTVGFLAQAIGNESNATLPYSDIETYKAWHPRKDTAYINGPLTCDKWAYGRDMYLFLGVLRMLSHLVKDGKATLNFDPKAEALALIERHPGPYTINNVPAGYWVYAKQMVTPVP